MSLQLYKDKKFKSWSFNKVINVLYEELKPLEPTLQKDVIVYGKKVSLILFKGSINVAIEPMLQRYPEKDLVQMYFGLSLSPAPYSLDTHVLNTFELADFIGLFPNLSGKHYFTINKVEKWDESILSETTSAMYSVVKTMLAFESCFHLLLDDECEIDGIKVDSKSLSLSHHLNQVKAYRLAEIYGHPEKLDEAIEAIKKFAQIDKPTARRIEDLRAKKRQDATNWLYTSEFLERLSK